VSVHVDTIAHLSNLSYFTSLLKSRSISAADIASIHVRLQTAAVD